MIIIVIICTQSHRVEEETIEFMARIRAPAIGRVRRRRRRRAGEAARFRSRCVRRFAYFTCDFSAPHSEWRIWIVFASSLLRAIAAAEEEESLGFVRFH